MAFTNDYIMRQIEMAVNALGEMIFKRDPAPVETLDEQGNLTEEGLLWLKIRDMMDKGQINQAENLLFEAMENDIGEIYLSAACNFYAQIGRWSEEKLKACCFSRREVHMGMREVARKYRMNVIREEGT